MLPTGSQQFCPERINDGKVDILWWIYYACGESENCDMHCKLETPTPDKPEFCPITGEENIEWIEDK